jgi:hypothetical protein
MPRHGPPVCRPLSYLAGRFVENSHRRAVCRADLAAMGAGYIGYAVRRWPRREAVTWLPLKRWTSVGGKFDKSFNPDKDPAWFAAERTPHRRY